MRCTETCAKRITDTKVCHQDKWYNGHLFLSATHPCLCFTPPMPSLARCHQNSPYVCPLGKCDIYWPITVLSSPGLSYGSGMEHVPNSVTQLHSQELQWMLSFVWGPQNWDGMWLPAVWTWRLCLQQGRVRAAHGEMKGQVMKGFDVSVSGTCSKPGFPKYTDQLIPL